MVISEKLIENFICETINSIGSDSLCDRGLDNPFFATKAFQQLDLSPLGQADIVTYGRHNELVWIDILELKTNDIIIKDIDQVMRYRKAVTEFLDGRFRSAISVKVSCALIGYGVSSGEHILDQLNQEGMLDTYTYHWSLKSGIQFRDIHSNE